MDDQVFILQEGNFPSLLAGVQCSAIYWLKFDVASYHAACAAELGIHMPDALAAARPKRLSEFVAGRCCARSALQEFAVTQVPAYGEQRQPIWPDGFWGSISHSDGIALAAVSRQQSIGLDIECLVTPELADKTAEMILTPTELARFDAQLTPELFTLIFSFKESFYKAAYPYVQRFFGFSAVEVIAIKPQSGQLVYRLNEHLVDGLETGMTGEASFAFPFPGQVLTMVGIDQD